MCDCPAGWVHDQTPTGLEITRPVRCSTYREALEEALVEATADKELPHRILESLAGSGVPRA